MYQIRDIEDKIEAGSYEVIYIEAKWGIIMNNIEKYLKKRNVEVEHILSARCEK